MTPPPSSACDSPDSAGTGGPGKIPLAQSHAGPAEAATRDGGQEAASQEMPTTTDGLRAEESLKLFRTLIDQSSDAFVVIDPKTARLLDVNEKVCTDLGYTREELLALSVFDISTTVTKATWAEVSELNREMGARILESYHVRKDGTLFPVEINIKWIKLERDFLVAIVRNITERKLIEQALQKSRGDFKDLFDNALVGYHEVDAQGRLVRINQTELKMLGYSEEELLGQFVWKISAEEAVTQQALQVKLNGVPPPGAFERKFRRKDGSSFPALIEDRLITGTDGAVLGIRSVIQDITESKLKQREVAREQARFQFIFGSVPVGITWMERGNVATRLVNPANERLTGVPIARCQEVELYRQATHPEDRIKQDVLHQRMLAGEIDHYTMEKRYVHDNGQISWVMLTVRSYHDPDNDMIQEISTMTDITERKQVENALRESEERFRDIADNITEVFWVTDWESGEVLYLSPGYEKIWGRSCESLYQSPDSWNDATHPDDQKRVREAFDAVAQVGSFDQIYRIARPDGSECWIHDRGRPIYDAEGKICRLVGIAADVTKEHKLEEQFRQAQKMEAIGTLAGGIAHDFNNILTAISGYTELAITASADNPKARGFLDSIAQAGARAADLVRQILTFSRQQEQQLRPIQLREVVEEALKLLRSTIPATIQFKTSYDPQVPTVLADASQIHQVLLNLGTNAWHAMRDQAGCLEVRLESFEVDIHLAEVQPRLRPGRYLRLSISDTGKGMARSTVDRIFEPFFTTKAPGEGTGLGLSVVHGIMQSHGGSIIVYSQPGAGTVFHLYFPAYLGKDSKASLPADPVPRGGGARILYVDDEEPLARLGQMNLERLDYSVEVQTNVVKALALVQADPNRYDLVITDYSMPGMTGIDFAARLLKLRADFPIILTTGYAANLTAERVGALGIRGLLLKPHTGHALGLAVHRALAREKLE